MDEVRFPPFAASAENRVTDGDSYHVARQLSARINHVWSRIGKKANARVRAFRSGANVHYDVESDLVNGLVP